ncbi:MAG TPA: hypothetical protein VKU38_11075 [Ktedonobacteraceae bacterium]|nr:hypothetical protein [Ktedonobacteraceae bacterium]
MQPTTGTMAATIEVMFQSLIRDIPQCNAKDSVFSRERRSVA